MNIKLLDGTTELKSKLIEKAYDDEFYYGDLNKKAFSLIEVIIATAILSITVF